MVLKSLRNAFLSGLLLLAPLGVTLFVIYFLVGKIGEPASAFFFSYVPQEYRGNLIVQQLLNFLSTFIVLFLVTLLGYLSKFVFGKLIVQYIERIMTSLPLVKTVYSTVKQIIDTFTSQKKAVFQKVVLLEFPRRGMYAIGFLTSDGKGEIQERTKENVVNVFLPTTPNPTSGYLVMVPENDIMYLDMPVADGMKLIISGGAVVPPYPQKSNVGLDPLHETVVSEQSIQSTPHH